jgi:hypothetical protein
VKRLLPSLCLAVLGNLAAPGELPAQDLVITNARIIDGTGNVIERGSIVIRDGRIVSVAAGSFNVEGVQTFDAGGMTAMPGFIDAHRHIMGGNSDQWFAEQAVDRMQEFLDAGFTTLMSGGGPVPGIVELERRIEEGELTGPRIITSGRVDTNNSTPEEARAQVRELASTGVEFIKTAINVTPGGTEQETLAAIADEGRLHGLETMVHAVTAPDMIAARPGACRQAGSYTSRQLPDRRGSQHGG